MTKYVYSLLTVTKLLKKKNNQDLLIHNKFFSLPKQNLGFSFENKNTLFVKN